MKYRPTLLFALNGLLVFQMWHATCEEIPADNVSKKAEDLAADYAHRASEELARGHLESAEQLAIESLGLLPRRQTTEEKRSAYRKQLANILAALEGTPEGTTIEQPEMDSDYLIGDVEDKVPFGIIYQSGASAELKEIILPKVEFSAISLTAALASLESLSREHDHYPLIMDRGVKISLDAPKLVANTAITLQLTDVPLSEAIQRTADLASCHVFCSGIGRSGVLISCVDLLTPVIEGDKIRVSPAAGMWHAAFWKLQNAEPAAEAGDRRKARYYYGEALNLYAILSVRHPEFFPEMGREMMKDVANKLGRRSPIE